MPDIKIVKFKVRRGTDAQRRTITLDQGELGYTLDTKRLWVGDGVTSGVAVGTKAHKPLSLVNSLTSTNSYIGDLVNIKGTFYQLTAADYTDISSWSNVGTRVDGITIGYDINNELEVKDDSITFDKLDSSNLGGDAIVIDSGGINVDFNTDFFELSGDKLSIIDYSLDGDQLSNNTLNLSGGLVFNANRQIGINAGAGLEIDAVSNTVSVVATSATIENDVLGAGLSKHPVTGKLQADINDVDTTTITVLSGVLSMAQQVSAAPTEFPYVTFGEYGFPTNIQSSISDALTGVGAVNNDEGVPIGTILPHANAIPMPAGYLMCDGQAVSPVTYEDLYDVIGVTYGGTPGVFFNLPNLSGYTVYGTDGAVGDNPVSLNTSGTGLSSQQVNFIIRALPSTNTNLFNGFPGQISLSGSGNNVTTYETLSNNGGGTVTVTLSSAGFITFENSQQPRNSSNPIDRFAIPIFNY